MGDFDISNKSIQPGYRIRTGYADNEKWNKDKTKEGIEQPNKGKNQNTKKEWNLRGLGCIRSGDERKKIRVHKTNKKPSQNQTCSRNLFQGINTWLFTL